MNATIAEVFVLAARYHAVGQLGLAEQHYRYVLSQEPQHAEALHRLGILAQQKGDHALAIDCLTRTVACAGATAAQWNQLGVVQTTAGNLHEATAAYEQALRLRPDFAEAFNNLGVVWHWRGNLESACRCFEQAILHRPAYPEAFNNLGNLLKDQGKREEALAAFERALQLKPDYAEAANSLGVALHEQMDLQRAMGCYRQALRLKPGYADASNNLATLLKEQGLLDEALAQYQETLRFQPGHVLAYYNLSQFVAEGRYRFGPTELDRLKTLLAGGQGSVLERSLLSFTLAAALEQQGCHDEAFAHYRQANELRRRLLQENNRSFDAPRHQALVDRVIAAFDPAYFRRVQGWGLDTELPVFVIGMPRSGTTLVEQILASHPAVFGAGELGEIPRLLTQWATKAGYSEADIPLPLLDREGTQNLATSYLRHVSQLGGQAARVTVKTIGNHLHLGAIATMFPRAHIIHCRRDPRDVGLSCYFQNFNNLDFAWSLEDIGAYQCQHDRLMAHWRQVLPLQIHEVCYEELIARQETVTRDLLAFCGLNWNERCLAFFNTRRTVRTASTLQVRKPLSGKSIGRWKRYRSQLEPLLTALGQPPKETGGELFTMRGQNVTESIVQPAINPASHPGCP